MLVRERLIQYAFLMRLDKPIGIFLLLWPTLWALWLANEGPPTLRLAVIFVAGTVIMRSLGCVINDFIDRNIDRHVRRTVHRPLASGKVRPREALGLAVVLGLGALGLALLCDRQALRLACVGALLTCFYPFLKRFIYLPQVGLGLAFAWGVPMAFAATKGQVGLQAWFLYLACLIWPIIYDTQYAMVDREDDLKIGVKSTAILFDKQDKRIIAALQLLLLALLCKVGSMFHLHHCYYVALIVAALLFLYQQWLIKDRLPMLCFAAFVNNQWLGMVVFLGIVTNYGWHTGSQ